MHLSKKLLVSSCISLAILSSCSQEKSPFDISPAESLDSKRAEAPFPNIPIPADVDMESPRWKGIDYQFFDLDHGQLDVQHLQRQTNPVDARWSDLGTYR